MSIPVDFLSELRKRFSGDIRLDAASRVLYSTDASIYQIEPLGVAIPRTQDDLLAAVELAAQYRVPILPRGSGSSLAGQAIGPAMIVDCSRWLDKIVDIDPEARTATVEPGTILNTLNRAAAKWGLMFGPDPASAERATMGGVIGNNATGAHSITYGMTADHILSADVILADGSLARWDQSSVISDQVSVGGLQEKVISAALNIREKYAAAIRAGWPRFWRNSAGYRLNYLLPWSPSAPPQFSVDSYQWSVYSRKETPNVNLAALLAGSEGTLAVIRRATVGLVPKPKHTVLGVLAYDSVAEACDDVPRLLAFSPSAVELIPQILIRLARGVPAYASQMGWVQGDPAALLAVEFSGDDPAALEKQARSIGDLFRVATSAGEQAQVWNVRKVGVGILDSAHRAERPVAFVEDCAVPVERLGEFVREFERILAAEKVEAAFYAHASAGCLHVRPMIDLRTGAGVRALRSIAAQVADLTVRVGGAMASEHGDGLARSEWLEKTYGKELLGALDSLKRAADPFSLLNPAKLLDAPPMDSHLRFGESYKTKTWKPVMAYETGLAGAIEQCNGAGVCRKQEGGVMCPSFRALREEKHSTRGRANLLRAIISNQLPVTSGEKAVYEALGLCLACKGCQAECPSGVDMAKLKYEFQHHYYRRHLRPLRDYLFGFINQVALLVGALRVGGLVNWFMRQGWVKWLLERALGISAKRPFPQFHVVARSRGAATKQPPANLMSAANMWLLRASGARNDKDVALYLPDSFSRYFEPEVEQAALGLLSACGVDVKVLPVLGAGRTLLSKGFLPAAKRHAEHVLDEIRRLDPQGVLPVVGVEPSEIYTLRDEFRALLPECRAEVDALAKRAWMVDEFLVRGAECGVRRIDRGIQQSKIENQKSKILLHGHCYQKAQPPADDGLPVGQAASAELLRALGCEVQIIDSGCCGMAGAFGYENEHYELSMAVGELGLLPAIRDQLSVSSNQLSVAADGTSCRSQISDGTGVAASHAVVLAWKAVNGR
jgi:FAD/FMN-containing dehydrogenase/Fe-S oxidoreductase